MANDNNCRVFQGVDSIVRKTTCFLLCIKIETCESIAERTFALHVVESKSIVGIKPLKKSNPDRILILSILSKTFFVKTPIVIDKVIKLPKYINFWHHAITFSLMLSLILEENYVMRYQHLFSI